VCLIPRPALKKCSFSTDFGATRAKADYMLASSWFLCQKTFHIIPLTSALLAESCLADIFASALFLDERLEGKIDLALDSVQGYAVLKP
jgi:hypothetical protein